MPNSSKIAFIFHGEPQGDPRNIPLEYIGNDVKKMKEVLELSWIVKEEGRLERSFFSEDSLSTYGAKEKDVLFYFSGHGIPHEDDIFDEYTLKLSNDETQNITTKELVAFLSEKLQPKTLTIILDACYSGQTDITINTKKSSDKIQILTSSDYLQESYENWGFESGKFTHFFCQAIESACAKDETGKITLGEIAEYIREPLKKHNQDIVKRSSEDIEELSSFAIAYNKEVWEIKEVLKEKFSTKEFKDKLFEFLHKDNLKFKEFLEAEHFDELLWLSLSSTDSKGILYCIFKELGISHTFLEAFQKTECLSLKEKAKNSREVKKIILRIRLSTEGKIDNCMVEGWLVHNIDTQDTLEKLYVDFSSDYISALSLYISEALKGRFLAQNPLDMELILDDKLFSYDFYPIAEKNRLNITLQLLSRNQDFFSSKVATVWKEKSEFLEKKKLEKIEKYIYPIDEIYERDNIKNCFGSGKIIIDSSHNLLTDKYLDMIRSFGLPIVISPSSDSFTKVNFKWEIGKMDNLKPKVMDVLTSHYNRVNYYEKEKELKTLDEEKNIQFICDNYHDVAKFKELINENRDEKIK